MATGKKGKKKSVFDDDFQEVTEQINATEMNKEKREKIEEPQVEFIEDNDTMEVDVDEVGDSFNPLQGEVIRREYAQQVGVANVPEVDRVPEPSISNLPPPPPPPSGSNTDSPFIGGDNPQQSSGSVSGSSSGGNQMPPQEPLNPEMQNLSNKDAKMASTRLVDGVLSTYKQGWGLGYNWISVDESKLVDLAMNDKVSLDVKINLGSGGEATLREVYEMFNTQAKEALSVDLQSEDFIKVREAMIREFTKRGWGVTDMQYIIQHFIRDAGQRAVVVYQLKGTIDNFTNGMIKQHEEIKKLREELTNMKEKVAASEPTVIHRKAQPQSNQDVVADAKNFVQSYEIRKEPEVSEVPHYEGNDDLKSGSNVVPIDNSTF